MIIIAGEALVDLVVQPDGEVSAALGGAPFNTARAAARLGADTTFVGTLSNDRFGTLLAAQLDADGVSLGGPRTDLPTTLAAAELDESGAAIYRFYIAGTSAPALPADAVAASETPDVLFTGGLGLLLEPMASTLTDLVVGSGDETLVMIDVNCRPSVVDDRAVYVQRVERVVGRADVVKVSDDDLAYLFPDLSIEDGARAILKLGATAVLVTAGSKHTTIVTADSVVDVPVAALGVPVVDTIGAGDTFGGGFVAWWTTHGLSRADVTPATLESAVVAAHAAAAVVVTRRGADPPRRDELPDDWS